jgi:hypothetical protein
MQWLNEKRQTDPEMVAKHYHPETTAFYRVKWRRGGLDMNVQNGEVELI